MRLKLHDKTPNKIKEFIRQDKLSEGHLEQISTLYVDVYFSPWLTTEQLWLSLAEEAIEKDLSVSKLKERVAQWKRVIAKADSYYEKLDACLDIGKQTYQTQEMFVGELAQLEAKTQKACDDAYKKVITFIEVTHREYENLLERQRNEETEKAHAAEMERLRIERLQRYEPKVFYKSMFNSVKKRDDDVRNKDFILARTNRQGNNPSYREKRN